MSGYDDEVEGGKLDASELEDYQEDEYEEPVEKT